MGDDPQARAVGRQIKAALSAQIQAADDLLVAGIGVELAKLTAENIDLKVRITELEAR